MYAKTSSHQDKLELVSALQETANGCTRREMKNREKTVYARITTKTEKTYFAQARWQTDKTSKTL